MTDSNLRQLEHRFRASGSVEDETAWLRARVQAGALEQSRLEVAAWGLHEAAAVVLMSLRPDWEPHSAEHMGRVPSDEWAPMASARVALATAERWAMDGRALSAAEGVYEKHWEDSAYEQWVWQILSAYQQWVICPDEARRSRIRAAHDAWPWSGDDGHGAPHIIRSHLSMLTDAREPRDYAVAARSTISVYLAGCLWARGSSSREARRRRLDTAIREEIVPWALGYSDPVRERVEARQREAPGE